MDHERLAEQAARQAAEEGIRLDYTPASVFGLEILVDKNWGSQGLAPGLPTWEPSPEVREAIARWGSYVGEILRRRYKGRWTADPSGNPTRSRMVFPSGELVLPIEAVYLRLKEGNSESLEKPLLQVRQWLGFGQPASREALEWCDQGDSLAKAGRADRALICYDRGIAIDPESERAWAAKAAVLEVLERFPQALGAARRALELNPSHPALREAVARLEKKIKQPATRTHPAPPLSGPPPGPGASPPAAKPPGPTPAESPAARVSADPGDGPSGRTPTARPRLDHARIAEDAAAKHAPWGIPLDFTAASIPALDAFLDEMWGERGFEEKGKDWKPPPEQLVAAGSLGCYLGEVIRRRHGGRWVEDAAHPEDLRLTRLVLPDGHAVFPVEQVYRRLKRGRWENLERLLFQVRDRLKAKAEEGEAVRFAIWAERILSLRRGELALRLCERAIAMDPECAAAWAAKGKALKSLGRLQEARTALEHALKLASAVPRAPARPEVPAPPQSAPEPAVASAPSVDVKPLDPPEPAKAAPVAPPPLPFDYAGAAEKFRVLVGAVPPYSPASLLVVDAFLSETWGESPRTEAERDKNLEWICGCYVGEALVRTFGARWLPDEPREASRVQVPDSFSISPFDLILTRHTNGSGDPVLAQVDAYRWQVAVHRDGADPNQAETGAPPPPYPDEARHWMELGKHLSETGKDRFALRAFERAVRLDPDRAEAWEMRGKCLRALGRNEDAIESYERARQLGLNTPEVAEALAACRAAIGRNAGGAGG